MAVYEVNSDEIIAQDFGDQVVIINLATGFYFSLYAVGAWIWNALEDNADSQEIIKMLVGSLNVTDADCKKDVSGFITQLIEKKLIIVSEKTAQPIKDTAVTALKKLSYVTPILEIHDDIRHLIALDPPIPGMQQQLKKNNP